MIFVFRFLTPLCVIGSKFIPLISTDSNAFFYGWVIFCCVYVSQLLYPFIYQWISRLLHVLAIISRVAMNIRVHVSFSILVSSGYMISSGIVGSYDFIPIFFKVITILFSIVVVSIYTPTNSARGFPLLHTLSGFYTLYIFGWCRLIYHCSFYLHFFNNEWCWASFHVFINYLYVFFG